MCAITNLSGSYEQDCLRSPDRVFHRITQSKLSRVGIVEGAARPTLRYCAVWTDRRVKQWEREERGMHLIYLEGTDSGEIKWEFRSDCNVFSDMWSQSLNHYRFPTC